MTIQDVTIDGESVETIQVSLAGNEIIVGAAIPAHSIAFTVVISDPQIPSMQESERE